MSCHNQCAASTRHDLSAMEIRDAGNSLTHPRGEVSEVRLVNIDQLEPADAAESGPHANFLAPPLLDLEQRGDRTRANLTPAAAATQGVLVTASKSEARAGQVAGRFSRGGIAGAPGCIRGLGHDQELPEAAMVPRGRPLKKREEPRLVQMHLRAQRAAHWSGRDAAGAR